MNNDIKQQTDTLIHVYQDAVIQAYQDESDDMGKKQFLSEILEDFFDTSSLPLEDTIAVGIAFLERVKNSKPLTQEERFKFISDQKYMFEIDVIDPQTEEITTQLKINDLKEMCNGYSVEVNDYLQYYRSELSK